MPRMTDVLGPGYPADSSSPWAGFRAFCLASSPSPRLQYAHVPSIFLVLPEYLIPD
ncbi:uncharacterized protein LY79DRAFT_547173 [Colletotrichum navitas]|uniref:Uncharacterized protein n=1 Tax=Colletotrichum navitas TaxID=681940 RepID=A0AAD8V8A4_9PEZI|nr:uncharacterized protein LY79DRAFT_547173 [Colletotrichum navitas]KAK1595250.1 hypothetical protein LY79DRAFT_547173 [Colletotrichum navitas]